MNPNPPRSTAWTRLAEAARRARFEDVGDIPAPYGFATRVAARALSMPATSAGPFFLAKMAIRTLCVVCLLAIVSVSINLGSILSDIDDQAGKLGSSPIEAAEVEAAPDSPPAQPQP